MRKEGKPLTGRKVARLLKIALDHKDTIERNKQIVKSYLDTLSYKYLCKVGKSHFSKTECITIRHNVLTNLQREFARALRFAGDYATPPPYTPKKITKQITEVCKKQAQVKALWG